MYKTQQVYYYTKLLSLFKQLVVAQRRNVTNLRLNKAHMRYSLHNITRARLTFCTNYTDAALIAELSEDLGEAMVGINEQEIELLMAQRGE